MITPKGKVVTNGLPALKGNTSFPYTFDIGRNKHVAELYENLTTQQINQAGLDIIYMPLAARTDLAFRDQVLGEMARKDYHNAHYMRVMMTDVQMLKGGENIYSKFGLTIQDSLTFFITIKHFIERIGETATHSDNIHKLWTKTDEINCKPEIQDLIYVPMYDSLYDISFAERYEHTAVGYSYGWMCYCKKFNYSTSENVYIDKNQTGFGNQTGMHEEYDAMVDSINLADSNVKRDEKINPILDPTQTGFDPTSTHTENDDMSKEATKVKKSGEKDLFNDW
jgi:hypothetical protein